MPSTHWSRRLFRPGGFTRSNGTISARIYERLTKQSRRRWAGVIDDTEGAAWFHAQTESAYREGVYDAFKALQEELKR